MPSHPHQHSVKVVASAETLEQAINHALAGLTDPKGHYGHMSFQTFEVIKIGGRFEPDSTKTVQVTLEAYASHKD